MFYSCMWCPLLSFCVVPYLSYVFSIASLVPFIPLGFRCLAPLLFFLVSLVDPLLSHPLSSRNTHENPQSSVLSLFFTRGLRYHKFFYSILLEACSQPVLSLLASPTQMVRRVFVGTQLSVDSQSRFLSSLLYIYPQDYNLPRYCFPFSLLFLFYSFPPASPQCKSTSPCYQGSKPQVSPPVQKSSDVRGFPFLNRDDRVKHKTQKPNAKLPGNRFINKGSGLRGRLVG